MYKTFISHELKHNGQKEEEQKLQDLVQQPMYAFIKTIKRTNYPQYKIVKGGLEEIFGFEHIINQKLRLLTGGPGPAEHREQHGELFPVTT